MDRDGRFTGLDRTKARGGNLVVEEAVKEAAEEFVLEYLQRDIEFMDVVEKLEEDDSDVDAEAVYQYAVGLLDDLAQVADERYSEK
jgi:hypothetical protein